MNLDFKFYWTLFLRRLPVMAALFLFCAGIGVALAIKLPTLYSTTARLLVEAPQIRDLAVDGNRGEQLAIIQQRLMTRANLIDIANRQKVFSDNPGMSPDAIVSAMRAATNIRRTGGRNRATLMNVGFTARNGRIAANVVNEYVTLILQENTRLRAGQAESTLAFFQQEVDRLNTELNLQSERIVAFKNENAGALPDSLNYRLNRETLLQDRVGRLEREIANLRDQRARIIEVYEATGRIQAPQQQQRTPAQQKLAQLQAQLENLRLVYSESHPRVTVVQTQIDQAEAQVAAEGGSSGEEEASQESILNIALAQIDGQIESIEENLSEDLERLDELRVSVEQTATNGIALDALERDYANAQQQYSDAIARRDQAQVSEQIELSSRGQRITVIEQANVPNRPSSPNRPMIMASGIGAGLVAMAGLFLLLELLNRSVRRPIELTSSLGITPLATVPYMETRCHFWVRRSLKLALLVAVIIAVPVGLWAVDQYYRPLDLIYDRLLAQLGL